MTALSLNPATLPQDVFVSLLGNIHSLVQLCLNEPSTYDEESKPSAMKARYDDTLLAYLTLAVGGVGNPRPCPKLQYLKCERYTAKFSDNALVGFISARGSYPESGPLPMRQVHIHFDRR
jgi:hypothetical protein